MLAPRAIGSTLIFYMLVSLWLVVLIDVGQAIMNIFLMYSSLSIIALTLVLNLLLIFFLEKNLLVGIYQIRLKNDIFEERLSPRNRTYCCKDFGSAVILLTVALILLANDNAW